MTARRRRDNRWYYRRWVRLPAGGRLRIFGVPSSWGLPNTRVGAESAEAKHVEYTLRTGKARPELDAPPPTEPAPRGTTVREFVPAYLASSEAKNKASTVDSKRQVLDSHILPALGDLELRAVTYAAIEDFKLSLLRATPDRPALSAKTANNVLTVLRRLLAIAARRGVISEVPHFEWMKVVRPEIDYLTFAEADRLVEGAQGEDRAMILTALRTGMRRGELFGLRWSDVDLVAGRIVVRQAIVRNRVTTPKSHKPREIPISDQLAAALRAHRHLRGDHVFCDADGRPLTKDSAKHIVGRARRRAGLRQIGWHTLRHTFASHLAMRGVPLVTIKELMGHATITMTLRYAHLAPEVTRDAVRLLDAGHPVPDRAGPALTRAPNDGK